MTRATLCLLVAAAACDPFTTIKPASELDDSRGRSLQACLDSCGDARDPDRAACRLDCATTFKPGDAAAPIDDDLTRAATCMGRCRDAFDAGACRTACRSPGPAYEQLDRCVAACHADATLTPANRATCESTCAQAARRLGAG